MANVVKLQFSRLHVSEKNKKSQMGTQKYKTNMSQENVGELSTNNN